LKESKAFLQNLDQDKLHDLILNCLQKNEHFEVAFKLAFTAPTDEDLSSLTYRIDKSLEAFTDIGVRKIDFPEVNEYMTRARQGYIKFAFDAAKHLFEQLVDMNDCFTYDCFTEDHSMNDCDVERYLHCRLWDFVTIAELATDREDRAHVFEGCLDLYFLDFSRRLAYFEREFLDISAWLLANENHLNNRSDLSFFEDMDHGDRFNQALVETTIRLYGYDEGLKLAVC
jgi:hypothetical protein